MANGKLVKRTELYQRAWSEPMSSLAKEFGISDVALAKACRKLEVPLPPRGWWARKSAGKPAPVTPLPPRPPGLDEETRVGARYSYAYLRWCRFFGQVDKLFPPSCRMRTNGESDTQALLG